MGVVTMEISIFFGLMVLTIVPLMVFHIWALVDVLKTSTTDWTRAEQNQIVWAIVVLALFVVGPILYLMIARPRLVAVRNGVNP